MAQAEEVGDRENKHVSLQMSNFPGDLLQRFISVNQFPVKLEESREDVEEIELSLVFSLNGQFGVDRKANKLKRSSSISDFANPVRDGDFMCKLPIAYTPIIRTCSLPTETEEEWSRRKELQTLRRMEGKRKLSEKQRISKAVWERSRAFGEEIYEDDNLPEVVNGNHQIEQGAKALNGFPNLVNPSLGMLACGLELNGEEGSGLVHGGLEKLPPSLPPAPAPAPAPAPSSQGSIGSQGTGSSGISESESLLHRGISKLIEARSPGSAPISTASEQKTPVTRETPISRNSGKVTAAAKGNRSSKIESADKGRNVLKDMPCVSTKGYGPNSKRIDVFFTDTERERK
ncbi:ninja-family protein AFP3-like [Quillaja saponaria]|uniref:Ninja-family protein n=1 Tax=Quillaja saponaria TaxID=32244 RepID=A0AAD7PXN0_QUISA|nr:ninja-family protein AFP3-like [Quillaja saponaria]KAJ7971071.1 ninja-family protein AFP3-like [Quillaja saponaria]